MSVDVIVYRGAGDRPAQDISSAMIVSKRVAEARGSAEVDRSCSDRLNVSGDLVGTDYVRRGLIVEVAEEEETWRGMTTGWEITWEMQDSGGGGASYAVNASLQIEREDNRTE